MTEHMGVRIEAWPLAADHTGIWVLGNDAWRSGRVPADSTEYGELDILIGMNLLTMNTELPVIFEHSFSWRAAGPNAMHTFAVIFDAGQHVQDACPRALPVTLDLAHDVGKPWPHDPAGPPVPRHIDVLLHTLGGLRHHYDTNSEGRARLGLMWRRHLEPFRPVLAGMYEEAV